MFSLQVLVNRNYQSKLTKTSTRKFRSDHQIPGKQHGDPEVKKAMETETKTLTLSRAVRDRESWVCGNHGDLKETAQKSKVGIDLS